MQTVSVIIPYKTDRGYLQQAIDSVHAQTYPNIELILSQSDNGVSYNLNRGIEKATGQLIRYLCDDDLLQPRSIEWSVEAMQDYDILHGHAVHFWASGKKMRQAPRVKQPTLKDMYDGNCIHGGSVMYRKSSFDKYGYFDESLWTGEEFDLNLKWLSQGATIGYVRKEVYLYRRHEQQKSVGVQTKEYHLARIEAIKGIKDRYRCKL
jgi:glycosyltransferase involved in cell wall biosynthesis